MPVCVPKLVLYALRTVLITLTRSLTMTAMLYCVVTGHNRLLTC